MDVLAATNMLITIMRGLGNLAVQATSISQIIQTANSEGRSTLTPTEWATINQADDASKTLLLAAIQKALAVKAA